MCRRNHGFVVLRRCGSRPGRCKGLLAIVGMAEYLGGDPMSSSLRSRQRLGAHSTGGVLEIHGWCGRHQRRCLIRPPVMQQEIIRVRLRVGAVSSMAAEGSRPCLGPAAVHPPVASCPDDIKSVVRPLAGPVNPDISTGERVQNPAEHGNGWWGRRVMAGCRGGSWWEDRWDMKCRWGSGRYNQQQNCKGRQRRLVRVPCQSGVSGWDRFREKIGDRGRGREGGHDGRDRPWWWRRYQTPKSIRGEPVSCTVEVCSDSVW